MQVRRGGRAEGGSVVIKYTILLWRLFVAHSTSMNIIAHWMSETILSHLYVGFFYSVYETQAYIHWHQAHARNNNNSHQYTRTIIQTHETTIFSSIWIPKICYSFVCCNARASYSSNLRRLLPYYPNIIFSLSLWCAFYTLFCVTSFVLYKIFFVYHNNNKCT